MQPSFDTFSALPAMVASGTNTAGAQWVGELHDCACTPELLARSGALEALCRKAAEDSGLTPLDTTFHQFEPGGATGVMVLEDSHLAVHTWPERGFVSIDLYVCNGEDDNRPKGESLFDSLHAAFQPGTHSRQVVHRDAIAAI